ncbi:Nucleolar phosphoprotein Nopp34 [Entamoeba marina]
MEFEEKDFVQLREEDVTNDKPIVRIRNLPRDLDESDYLKYFKQYGKMKGLTLLRSKKSGSSLGIVFVRYEDADIARIVSDTLNRHILDGRLLRTELLEAKNDKNLKPMRIEKKTFVLKDCYITKESIQRSKEKDEKLLNELKKYGIDFELPN